jgi:23S rRNA (adenine2503-C2)-methyltransferase
MNDSEKVMLKDMSLDKLTEFFVSIGEKPYRARQVFRHLMNGAASWDEMTDLSLSLRERLAATAVIDCLRVRDARVSRLDGTRKYLFETRDGLLIETVLMQYYYGYSVCISSQAGCRMGCLFCASGRHGLARDLTPGEIADQYIICERELRTGFGDDESGGASDGAASGGEPQPGGPDGGESYVRYVKHTDDEGRPRIGHIVVMGVGEPFDNYDNVLTFLKNVTDPQGRNLGRRQITVSTCGLPEGMRRFMNDLPQANLSLSLHAPNDGIRRRLMPGAASRCGIGELIAFAREYSRVTGRRFSFEYALFAGVNDSLACADELADKLAGGGFHVNLIPANSVPGSGPAPGPSPVPGPGLASSPAPVSGPGLAPGPSPVSGPAPGPGFGAPDSGFKAPGRGAVTAFAERLMARGIRTTTRRELGADIAAACGQLRSERMGTPRMDGDDTGAPW